MSASLFSQDQFAFCKQSGTLLVSRLLHRLRWGDLLYSQVEKREFSMEDSLGDQKNKGVQNNELLRNSACSLGFENIWNSYKLWGSSANCSFSKSSYVTVDFFDRNYWWHVFIWPVWGFFSFCFQDSWQKAIGRPFFLSSPAFKCQEPRRF